MSLLIITRMKGQNEIFCQPTIACIFGHEPQQIATRATGRRPLLYSILSKYCKWLVSPVWFRNLPISGCVR